MRSNRLRPSRDRQVPEILIFIDTETETSYSDDKSEIHRLSLACYETWHTDELGYPIRLMDDGVFFDEQSFYDLIKDCKPCRVVAHNWNFDASALRIGARDNLSSHGYDIDFGRSIVGSNGMYAPFLLTLDFDGVAVELICSTNYFKLPLSVIGETFGIGKMDMPTPDTYTTRKAYLSDLETYCQRDVEILRKAWFALWEMMRELGSVNAGITIAETAMRLFTSRYMPSEYIQGSKGYPDVERAESQAYRGGRTDTFFKGSPKGKTLYKYDVNSLYPSVMLHPVPYHFNQYVSAQTILEKASWGFDDDAIHLIDTTLNIKEDNPYAFIGLDGVPIQGRGLVFGIGRFRAWLWQPMFERALKYDMVERVHDAYMYECAPIFAEYVSELYDRRKVFKQSGDKASDTLIKLLLNSLYGKFGQRENTRWIEATGNEYLVMARNDGVVRWTDSYDGEVEKDYIQLGNRLWSKEQELIGEYKRQSVLSIAGYITASARAVLWDGMKTILDNGGTIYMCDTDSLVSDIPLPETMVDAAALGKWALEGVIQGSDAIFRAPKDYVWADSVKMKGIRNPQAGVSTYEQTQFPRFMTDLNSASELRRQRLEQGAVLVKVLKTANGVNIKRLEMGDGQPTLPLTLDIR